MIPLLIAAAGLGAVGKILGGIGANNAAKARAAALETNAKMDLAESGLAASLGLEEDDRVQASLAVNAAAGVGGGLGGSALGVLADLGRQSLMKTKNIAYRGQTQAWSARNDAAVTRVQGQQALAGSIISAGSSMLGAFAQSAAAKRGYP